MRIGLDFGTTNSGAAVFDGQRVRVLPLDPASRVAISETTPPSPFQKALTIYLDDPNWRAKIEDTLTGYITQDKSSYVVDLVELIMSMEEEFDIDISDEDAEKLVTFKDVIDYIKANS